MYGENPVTRVNLDREQARHERKIRLLQRTFDPLSAVNAASIATTYPQLPPSTVAEAAVAGLGADAPELAEIEAAVVANNLDKRDKSTNPLFGNESLLDNIFYDPFKGMFRWAFLLLGAPIEEAEGLLRAGTAAVTGQDVSQYGGSDLRYAINELINGRPVNLGEGFLPGGDLAPEARALMQQGSSVEEAYQQVEAQQELGRPIGYAEGMPGYGEEQRSRIKIGEPGSQTPVSFGRLAAHAITEPGTRSFHYLSGTLDFGKQIFLDPANIVGGYVGKVRKGANLLTRTGMSPEVLAATSRALAGDVLLDGTRKSIRSTQWHEYLLTKEGREYLNWFVNQTGDEGRANIFRLMRGTQNRPVDPRIINRLAETDNVDDAMRILVDPEAAGVSASDLAAINRRFGGEMPLVGGLADMLTVGSLTRRRMRMVAEPIESLPGRISRANTIGEVKFRPNGSRINRLGAQIVGQKLDITDPGAALNKMDDLLRNLGTAPEKADELLARTMQIDAGDAHSYNQIVKEALDEWNGRMVELDPDFGEEFTRAMMRQSEVPDELKKYWISANGDEVVHPGSRQVVNGDGEIVGAPQAHLMSQWLNEGIPLPDMREIRRMERTVMVRSMASKTHQEWLRKMVDSETFDTVRRSMEQGLDFAMSKAWKPLQLLRLAWTVRVVGDEQMRMAAAGLEPGSIHPMQVLSMLFSGKSDEMRKWLTDAADNPAALNQYFRQAQAARGGFTVGVKGNRPFGFTVKAKGVDLPEEVAAGYVIEINQLRNDPLALAVAQRVTTSEQATGQALNPERITTVIDEIKDALWDGDLAWYRQQRIRDGSGGDALRSRAASDDFVDSILARFHTSAGSEVIYFDTRSRRFVSTVSGAIEDADLPRYGIDPTSLTAQPRGVGQAAAERLRGEMGPPPQGTTTAVDDMLTDILDPDNFDMNPEEIFDELESWVGDMIAQHGLDPTEGNLALTNMSELVSDLYTDDPEAAGDAVMAIRRYVESLIDQSNLRPDTYATARMVEDPLDVAGAQSAAARSGVVGRTGPGEVGQSDVFDVVPSKDVAEMTDAELLRAYGDIQRSDYDLLRAQIARAEADGDMVRATELRGQLRQLSGQNIGRDYPGYENVSGVRVVVADIIESADDQGAATRAREVLGLDTEVVDVIEDGVHIGRVTLHRDETGRLAGISKINVDQTMERPYATVLSHLVTNGTVNPSDMTDAFMHGVPFSEWTRRIAKATGLDPDEIGFTDLAIETIEAARRDGTFDPSTTFGVNLSELLTGSREEIATQANEIGEAALEWVSEAHWATRGERWGFVDDAPREAFDPTVWPQHSTNYNVVNPNYAGPVHGLLEAVATGRIGDLSIDTLDGFTGVRGRHVNEVINSHWYPQIPDNTHVRTPVFADKSDTQLEGWDRALQWLWNAFMGRPTSAFSRSPAYMQYHWDHATVLAETASPAARRQIVEAAINAGIVVRDDAGQLVRSGRIQRILGKGREFNNRETIVDETVARLRRIDAKPDDVAGNVMFDDVADLTQAAHQYALEATRGLLYDQSMGHAWTDMARWISPFAEAWWEVSSTWARLMNENPRLWRRLQQGIEGGRESNPFAGVGEDGEQDRGWFARNDFGEEVFVVPGSSLLTRALLGMDDPEQIEFTARTSGLSMVGEIMPGIGPIVQVPLSRMGWTQEPSMKWLTDVLMPFGASPVDPGDPSTWTKLGLPNWIERTLTAIGKGSPDNKRLFANTTIDVMKYLMSTPEYANVSDPADYGRMVEEAGDIAQRLWIVRAFSSAAAPTSASLQFNARIHGDELWTYSNLGQAYWEILDRTNGDEVEAFGIYTELFGVDPSLYSTSKTVNVQPRAVTLAAADWQRDNADLYEPQNYPLTAYYARPDDLDEPFDYQVYLEQLKAETRQPLTPWQWSQKRNQFLGRLAYSNQQRKMEASGVTGETRNAYLRSVRSGLMQMFPGYNTTIEGLPERAGTDDKIAELYRWSADSRLAESETGQAVALYLAERDKVIRLSQTQLGYTSDVGFRTGKRADMYRRRLRMFGDQLVTQYPTFEYVWSQVLLPEIDEPQSSLQTGPNLQLAQQIGLAG